MGRRVAFQRQLNVLTTEQAESDRILAGNLNAQLGYYREELEALAQKPSLTADERAERDRLNAAISRTTAQLAENRGEGIGAKPETDAQRRGRVRREAAEGARAERLADREAREAAAAAATARDLQEAVVTANREKGQARTKASLDLELETIQQQRDLAESLTSAMADGDEKSLRAAQERFGFTARELALREQIVAAESRAANDDNRARRDSVLDDPTSTAAEKGVARAEFEARQTEITNRATRERKRLETENQANGLRLLADANDRQERMQAEHYQRAQAESEAYWGSDEELAARAGTVSEQMQQGLVKSFRDVDEAQRSLNEALGAAETDAERERIIALQKELGKLSRAFEKATRSFGDELTAALNEAADIAAGLSGLLASAGVGGGAGGSALGDAIGVIGSGADLAGAISKGDIGGAVKAGISTAANVAKMITGFGQRAEEEARNRRALAAAAEATDRNTQAMLETAVVGENVTREQLAGVSDGLADTRRQVAGMGSGAFGIGTSGASEATDAVAEYLASLAARGLDVQSLQAQFEAATRLSDVNARRSAFEAVLNATEARFGALAKHLGEYGASVEGALRQFADAQKYTGIEGAAAMREFVRLLRASGKELGDLGGVLSEIDRIDPSSPEGQAQIAALAAQVYEGLANGSFNLGSDLSSADVRRILDTALGIGGAGGSSGSTQAGSVSSITAVQGNQLLAYEQEQLRATREGFATANAALSGILSTLTGQSASSTVEARAASVTTAGSSSVSVTATVTVGERMTDEEVGQIAGREIARKLAQARPTSRGGRT